MRLVRYTYPAFRTATPSLGGCARSPWSGLESEIDRLFENTVGSIGSPTPARFAVDLFEDKANIYVRAELPGLKREDITVEMADGYLTIAATRKVSAQSTDSGQAAEGKEPESFSFSRAVSIGEDVRSDKVIAAYENGVLTVTLPKQDVVQPRKITVAVN